MKTLDDATLDFQRNRQIMKYGFACENMKGLEL